MKNTTETSALSLLANDAGYDPLEDRLRENIRSMIEAVFEEELAQFLGRCRYGREDALRQGYRNGHRERYIPPPSSQSNPDRRLYAVPFWSAAAGSTGRLSGGLLRRRSQRRSKTVERGVAGAEAGPRKPEASLPPVIRRGNSTPQESSDLKSAGF